MLGQIKPSIFTQLRDIIQIEESPMMLKIAESGGVLHVGTLSAFSPPFNGK